MIMVTKNSISVEFYPVLLEKTLERFRDVSSNVRKAALKLVEEIIVIHGVLFDIKEG